MLYVRVTSVISPSEPEGTSSYRRCARFLTFTPWIPTISQTQLHTFIITTNSDAMFEQSVLKYVNREAPPLQVVPGLRMSGAVPLFRLYAFISWRGPTLTLLLHLYTMHVRSSICDHCQWSIVTSWLMHGLLVQNTVVPPHPLIQYPRFTAARKKKGKLKK
jgi:hypothetical protein